MSELDGLVQRLAIQNLLTEVRELRAKVEQVTRAQDTARTRLPESAKFELENSDGEVVARLGGSDTGEIIEYVDGPTPNPPLLEADMLSAGPGQISVRSEGLDVYEDPAPRDFHALRVHVSLDPVFEPSDATAQGRLSTPKGVASVTVDPGLWHVGIEYETKSGKLSGLSEIFEIEVAPLVDADEIDEAIEEAKTELEQAIDERGNREGTEPPTEPAHDGVIYYQRDTENGPATAVWIYRDNQWHGLPLTDAVLTSVTTDKLVAGESLIDGVLFKDGAVTLEKMTVTEEMMVALLAAKKIEAGDVAANAIDGMTITGATMQTMAEAQRGIKLRAAENDLVAYANNNTQSFRVDGNTGQLTARGAEFLDGEVIGGYVGTAKTGKRVYLEGDNLTARDANNNVSARFGPDGIQLTDPTGNLQDIGNHIYGGVTFSSYTGSKGASAPLGTATAYGNYLGATWPEILTASHARYRCDVSFNVLAHGRTAGSDGWIDFWIIPRTPDDVVYGGSFFRREVYIGAPMFDVSLNYSMVQITDLPSSMALGDPMRIRWQVRNRGLSLCQISNLTITLTPA